MAYDRNDRRGGRKGRRKVCSFCVDKVETIDYKDVPRLRKFISDRSKILPRRVTGTSIVSFAIFFSNVSTFTLIACILLIYSH